MIAIFMKASGASCRITEDILNLKQSPGNPSASVALEDRLHLVGERLERAGEIGRRHA
jgi:hypothetical protein